MRELLLILAFGAVLCEIPKDDASTNLDIGELGQPERNKDTRKEEFKKNMLEVRKNVSKIIDGLKDAYGWHLAVFNSNKTREEKLKDYKKFVDKDPKVYRALHAILRIVSGRPFPRPPFSPLHRIHGRPGHKGPRPFGKFGKRGPKGHRKEGMMREGPVPLDKPDKRGLNEKLPEEIKPLPVKA